MAAQFGRRVVKGAATTAVAAVAVAALSASQAPGVTDSAQGRQNTGSQPSSDPNADNSATGNSPYYTDLPPLNSPTPSPSTGTGDAEAARASRGGHTRDRPRRLQEGRVGAGRIQARLQPALATPRRHRQGRVRPGPRRPCRRQRHHDHPDPRPGPQRQRLREDHRHRRRRVRRGHHPRPCRRPHAVHPLHLGVVGPRRQRRRQEGPQQHLRRGPRRRPLPVPVRLGPVRPGRPQARDPQLQQLDALPEHRPDVAGVLPQGHPRDPGRHGHGARAAAATRQRKRRSIPAPRRRGRRPRRARRRPATEKPSGDGGSTSPSPKPPTTPPSRRPRRRPPRRPTTPTETVDHLEDAGTGKLTATAGDAFTQKIATRTETKAGKAVAKVRVRFTIVGATDAVFTGGESVATVVTNSLRRGHRARAQGRREDGRLHGPRHRRRPCRLRSRLQGDGHRAPGRRPRPYQRHRADLRRGRRVREPGRGEGHLQGRRRGRRRGHRHAHQGGRTTRPRTTRAPTSRTRTARPYGPSRASRRTRTAC